MKCGLSFTHPSISRSVRPSTGTYKLFYNELKLSIVIVIFSNRKMDYYNLIMIEMCNKLDF